MFNENDGEAGYERTISHYRSHAYHKRNYAKKKKKKKKKKHISNLKKINRSFGKPVLMDNDLDTDTINIQSPIQEKKKKRKLSGDSAGSNGSVDSRTSSIGSSPSSGKGSLSSLLTTIEGVPPSEWFMSRIRAIRDVFMLSWPIFLTRKGK